MNAQSDSQQSVYTLPPELWLLVVSQLSQLDIACLSSTCRRLQHVIRAILYQSVSLKGEAGDADPSPTLALLARDAELAKCVVELRLDRRFIFATQTLKKGRVRHCLVNANALVNLLSLKRIAIRGSVFSTAIELNEFGRALSGLSVEEFTYIGYYAIREWPGDEVEGISDLKKIVWDAKNLRT